MGVQPYIGHLYKHPSIRVRDYLEDRLERNYELKMNRIIVKGQSLNMIPLLHAYINSTAVVTYKRRDKNKKVKITVWNGKGLTKLDFQLSRC